jgi:hypothetical protein
MGQCLEDIDIGVRRGSFETLEYGGMESGLPRDVQARVGVPNPMAFIVYRTETRGGITPRFMSEQTR